MFCLCLSLLMGCGGTEPGSEEVDPFAKNLNEIMAAKTPFALSKVDTPVLSTHDWDGVFGGETGTELKYDRYSEIDELVFVAPPKTLFTLQRQIRKETRAGDETIYYKVTTADYKGSLPLWVDGRFLDLRDVRPKDEREKVTPAKTLIRLRSYNGAPYTWNGSSPKGVPEILDYYPPLKEISLRMTSDWSLKGFDSLGMLYRASGGKTPLKIEQLPSFGKPVFIDLDAKVEGEEEEDKKLSENDKRLKRAERLISALRPLDIIYMNEQVWIVLDKDEVIQSRYFSAFDGGVRIGKLIDTVYGLMGKSVFVKNPFEELENKAAKKFYIRRYVDTSALLSEQLDELTKGEENSEALVEVEGGEYDKEQLDL